MNASSVMMMVTMVMIVWNEEVFNARRLAMRCFSRFCEEDAVIVCASFP